MRLHRGSAVWTGLKAITTRTPDENHVKNILRSTTTATESNTVRQKHYFRDHGRLNCGAPETNGSSRLVRQCRRSRIDEAQSTMVGWQPDWIMEKQGTKSVNPINWTNYVVNRNWIVLLQSRQPNRLLFPAAINSPLEHRRLPWQPRKQVHSPDGSYQLNSTLSLPLFFFIFFQITIFLRSLDLLVLISWPVFCVFLPPPLPPRTTVDVAFSLPIQYLQVIPRSITWGFFF